MRTELKRNSELVSLFGWLAIIGPLHMVEQLFFGIEELQEMKAVIASFLSNFQDPDYGIVVLVTMVGASFLAAIYAVAAGGRGLKIVAAVLALLSIGEVHHVLRVVLKGSYNPGVVTSVAFVWIGVLLARAVWRRRPASVLATAAA